MDIQLLSRYFSSIKMPKTKKGNSKPAAAVGGAGAVDAPMADDAYAALMKRAEAAIDEADLDQASLVYEEALVERPDDVHVLDALGEIYYTMGDHDRAETLLCKSAELAPRGSYSKWMYLGQMYEGTDAVVAYKKGVELLTAQVEALPVAAVERPRLARELSDAYCAVAELYMTDLCDEDDAEATANTCAERAVAADGENPEALRVLANVRLCQQRPTEAPPLLSRAVALCEALYPDSGSEDGSDDDDDDDDEGDMAAAGGAGAAAAKSSAAAKKGGKPAAASLRAAAAAASRSAAATAAAAGGAGAGGAAPAAGAEGAAAADATGPGTDRTALLPPYDARKELAKACMEAELYSDALTALGRLSDEDEADMEVAYLTGEAFYLSGDCEGAEAVLSQAEERLTAAIDRISSAARKDKSKKARRGGADSMRAAYAVDGLMRYDLDDLETQRGMIRKLRAVAAGAAPRVGAAAAAGGASAGAGAGAGAGASGGMAEDA